MLQLDGRLHRLDELQCICVFSIFFLLVNGAWHHLLMPLHVHLKRQQALTQAVF